MITLDRDTGPMRYPLIVNDDGRDILVQADQDWPGVASSFGWSTRAVIVRGWRYASRTVAPCEHDGTDGTIDCGTCGTVASEFIAAAAEFLADNVGATADDPGYFTGDV